MSSLRVARRYADFGISIPGYVKRKGPSFEGAKAQIKARLETRNERFLQMVEQGIFDHPRSPYIPLLKAAGCELGDLRNLVESDGIESALLRLRKEGVYFSFEEFKGREPVNRLGVSFRPQTEDFSNPRARRTVPSTTGGSTGRPTRVWSGLEFRDVQLASWVVGYHAHGIVGIPTAWYWTANPAVAAFGLTRAKIGFPDAWFASGGRRSKKEQIFNGMARRLIVGAARLGGMRLPAIEWVDRHDLSPTARWLESAIRQRGRVVLDTHIGTAVRVGIAAAENGIDLHGASIIGTGEPPTSAKVRVITQTGAKFIPWYGFNEGGGISWGCANPVDDTDTHFFSDQYALIQYPRQVPGSDLMVDAFNFTTLAEHAPFVLMNVEFDDFGVFEHRDCGCLLQEAGFGGHIREVFSFRKLTGEGVTLVGSDMIRILEEVLPRRFGGTPLDYQLAEEEGEDTLTKLSLFIHPRLRIDDDDLVIQTVLDELASSDSAGNRAARVWAQSGTLQIKRREPVLTGPRAKLMPLHVSHRARQ